MANFSFEYPYIFLLLLVFILCARFCKARREAIIFPHLDIFMEKSSKESLLLSLLKWLAIISAVVALASPILEDNVQVENRDGYSIALVLDASGSMQYGFGDNYYGLQTLSTQSKFDVSMELANAFVKKRKDDHISLVVFGNFAYVAAPLTYDKKVLSEIMANMKAGMAGSNYTVINDALFQSAKLFAKSKSKTKIAILLTDGQTRGDNIPFDIAMKLVDKYGVKVYTVGIGNDRDFNKVHLVAIAQKSGGRFFSANNKEALSEIYKKIDMLEKSKIESEKYIQKSYYFEFPLFIAFLSLLFYTFLLNKRGSA